MSDGAREDRRQIVHLAMTGFAVALRWLSPGQAAACAGVAVVLNWVVLPALAAQPGDPPEPARCPTKSSSASGHSAEARHPLRRVGEPFVDGVRMYPIAVLGLVLLLPLPLAAAAWGVLGVGDAVSNLAGRRWGRPGFLGRPDRSLVGSLAFVVTAAPAAMLLMAVVGPDTPPSPLLALCAALAGAAAEFTPRSRWLDDNLPIAAAAGAALFLLAPIA